MSDINKGVLAENQDLSEFEITENFSCVRSVSYTHLTLPTNREV